MGDLEFAKWTFQNVGGTRCPLVGEVERAFCLRNRHELLFLQPRWIGELLGPVPGGAPRRQDDVGATAGTSSASAGHVVQGASWKKVEGVPIPKGEQVGAGDDLATTFRESGPDAGRSRLLRRCGSEFHRAAASALVRSDIWHAVVTSASPFTPVFGSTPWAWLDGQQWIL